jgi:DNA repair exonuclease SbcCD ATPase subunit
MNDSAAATSLDNGDLRALLEKIRALEEQNRSLATEKDATARERAALAERLDQSSSKLSALTQKTQDEMMAKINTTIATWLQSMGGLPEEKRTQVRHGLEELAKATAEDSGLFQVMCCASEQHIANVTQLEEVRRERDELQKRLEGGTFAREEARVGEKRRSDVISADEPAKAGGMWDDFKIMLQNDKGWCQSITGIVPAVNNAGAV